MHASVHITDLDRTSALRVLARRPRPSELPGLRHADVAMAAPFSGSILPAVQLRRVAILAFWDDDASIDGFHDHPLGSRFASGWHARLEPLRAVGSWPGLATDIATTRDVPHDGPAAVLTLGRVRLGQLPRFLRTTAKAGERAIESPGFVWGTALARPPFVATCSVWDSTRSLTDYAYGPTGEPHPQAMAADRAKPFHHRSAFVRFHISEAKGELEGPNPLAGVAVVAAGRATA